MATCFQSSFNAVDGFWISPTTHFPAPEVQEAQL